MMRCRPPKWRKNVTVCIAAICKHKGEPRIVLCSDWKGEVEGLAGSETTDKLRRLPKGWMALMADKISRATELVAYYETAIGAMSDCVGDKPLFSAMRKPAQEYKAALIDDYIRQMLGISYETFRAQAEHLPADFVSARMGEVSAIRLQAQLILAGFVQFPSEPGSPRLPYLFSVGDDADHQDMVRVEDSFAAIGAGAYVAIPAIHQREHDDDKSLMETIYTVFEAKRLSEIVPGVGGFTSIDVMEPSGKVWSITDAGHERCETLFARLGPKLEIGDKRSGKYFTFDDSYLEPFEDEEDQKATGAGANG